MVSQHKEKWQCYTHSTTVLAINTTLSKHIVLQQHVTQGHQKILLEAGS